MPVLVLSTHALSPWVAIVLVFEYLDRGWGDGQYAPLGKLVGGGVDFVKPDRPTTDEPKVVHRLQHRARWQALLSALLLSPALPVIGGLMSPWSLGGVSVLLMGASLWHLVVGVRA